MLLSFCLYSVVGQDQIVTLTKTTLKENFTFRIHWRFTTSVSILRILIIHFITGILVFYLNIGVLSIILLLASKVDFCSVKSRKKEVLWEKRGHVRIKDVWNVHDHINGETFLIYFEKLKGYVRLKRNILRMQWKLGWKMKDDFSQIFKNFLFSSFIIVTLYEGWFWSNSQEFSIFIFHSSNFLSSYHN